MKIKISFFIVSWWKSLSIIIVETIDEIIRNHDVILNKKIYLNIYIDENEINDIIKTSTVIFFSFVTNEFFMITNKLQTHLNFFIEFTIYSKKLIDFNLTLKIVENHFHTSIIIFTNNQTVIQIIKHFKNQSKQYIFRELIQRIIECDNEIKLHWIFAHVEISKNEIANIAAKKTTNWNENSNQHRSSLIFKFENLKIFIVAVKNEIRIRIHENWIQKWTIDITNRVTHRINKKFSKKILQKFRFITRSKNSMIIQIRTKKIDFKNYLHKINAIFSFICFCEYKKQTIHHTLLKCSEFEKLKKKCESMQINEK